MTSLDILPEYIILNEGLNYSVYLDSLKIPTIGVGFNLERKDAAMCLLSLGLQYDDVISGSVSLTDLQIRELLGKDIAMAVHDTKSIFGDLSEVSDERKIVLYDMAFNLGQARLSQFVNLVSAVKKSKWNSAAREMRNSKWANQVGRRAAWNIFIMKNNRFPNDHPFKEINKPVVKRKSLIFRFIDFLR